MRTATKQTFTLAALAILITFAIMLLCAGAGRAASADTGQWREYHNERFGYVFTYPANFVPQREADNGDGRMFIDEARDAEIAVWGGWLMEDSFAENFEVVKGYILTGGGTITYSKLDKDWYVISGLTPEGYIYYQRTLFAGDATGSYQLTYPREEQEFFGEIIKELNRGFVMDARG